jgi:hypothetical protein
MDNKRIVDFLRNSEKEFLIEQLLGFAPTSALMKMLPERFIVDKWYTSDVQQMRDDLTDDQAWEVLTHVKRWHDASVGINWDVIESAADELFPRKS